MTKPTPLSRNDEELTKQLGAIADKHLDDEMDAHCYTSPASMMEALREAYALGCAASEKGPSNELRDYRKALDDIIRESDAGQQETT